MRNIRYFTIGVALIAMLVTITTAPARAADENEAQLIEVLTSDSPKADKAITCKRLAVYGTKDAVPALAALLPDEQLTSWARTALEVIPGPEADAALRDAMGKVEGRVLIGVINSIAVRRDAGAVDGLAKRLEDSNADVASAAAVALGRIGNAPATKTLAQSLRIADATVRSAVAEGCVLSAEKLLATGKTIEASALYDAVRKADVPKQRVIEATRGVILAKGSDGIPILVEQLRAKDKAMFRLALQTARELPGSEVTVALALELGNITPQRQALLVTALADRNDDAVMPAVLAIAKNGSNRMRVAAASVLQRVGDASCVPVLLDIAAANDPELTQAAVTALEGLPGDDVDATLVANLSQADHASRPALIEVVGRRRIAAAVPSLLKAADDADTKIRSLALTSLGSTVEPKDLSFLIGRVVSPKNAEDTPAAEEALKAASIRMPDGDACAAQLTAAMADVPVATKCSLLEILGAMGGNKALETLGTAAKDARPELQDTASRLLGEWMTVDAAPVLLDLAKTAPQSKYQIRAMRGYIRLVRQFVVPDKQRAEMCRAALETAQRDAEKKLVLEVMERYPSIEMLKLSADVAKIPALKDDATRISLIIAQKIGGKAIDVQALLAQLGQDPVKVEIIKAEYGAGTKQKDVTEILRRSVRDLPLIVLPSSQYNAAFGGDPASGVVKQLKVQYRIDGKAGEATFAENALIMLPAPK